METPRTLPQYFLNKVQEYGAGKVALRQKEFGIWREFSWEESYKQVKAFSLGMIALGLRREDKVCSIGDNDREYLWAFFGLQAAGGVQVGLFTDSSPKEIDYIVNHSEATFVLAQDQEQCDKLLEIKDEVPHVKRVIYWDDKGMWYYDDEWLMSFQEVQELGNTLAETEPDRFDIEIASGHGDDLAIICYTSGTTGLPKGVMLNHTNIIYESKLYQEADPRYDTDNHVSFLPLGWIGEVALGFAPHVYTGIILNFPEEPETVRENIREIAPEGILFNSRLWDNLLATVQVRMNDATWINRKLYDLFLQVGYRVADKHFAKEKLGLGLKVANTLGDLFILSPLRDKVGMSNIRSAYTAGSALSPDAMRFFHALGINLKQIYGSTEVTGGATIHPEGDVKFASVGKPIPDVDIRTSDEGEIRITGPTVFMGYYKDAEETEKSILVDEDGRRWFCTGDAGYIDEDGHIIYLDRLKDMITLANGERFSPQFIEGRLKFSPYIRDVMAIGGPTREYATALIIIDFENVGHWAEKRGTGYTTFLDLSQKEDVYQLVNEAVADVNESLPPAGRVRRFVLMHKEFDADEAEMTRTRKLRRSFLNERYGEIVEAMYDGQDSVHVRAPVRYRDGTEGVVETDIRVATMD
jgi:long-chain acyl-CoA synthetase